MIPYKICFWIKKIVSNEICLQDGKMIPYKMCLQGGKMIANEICLWENDTFLNIPLGKANDRPQWQGLQCQIKLVVMSRTNWGNLIRLHEQGYVEHLSWLIK